MSAEIDDILTKKAAENGGILSFRDFSKIALFDKNVGYYARERKRVGFSAGTDFYTASALGEVFGNLIISAAKNLLGTGTNLKEFSFVEIGAEPEQKIFKNAEKIFARTTNFRLGEKIEIPEKAVVFGNELFDAQPFYRLVFLGGKWREIGVEKTPENSWREKILPGIFSENLRNFAEKNLPKNFVENWHFDISLDAEILLEKILAGTSWRGIFIFPDYGKTLRESREFLPAVTARAFFQQEVSGDLTKNPGKRDLTCDVFWDRLSKTAENCGFGNVKLWRQEAFFMKNSLEEISKIVAPEADSRERKSAEALRERQKLMEIVHPAKLGHAFQILSGTRGI